MAMPFWNRALDLPAATAAVLLSMRSSTSRWCPTMVNTPADRLVTEKYRP